MNIDVAISAGAHDPPLPYMRVGTHGFLVDLSAVHGALWDPNTVASVTWSKGMDGRWGGRVSLKNGTGRNFFDAGLLTPYVDAWRARQAELARPAGAPAGAPA
jgi:hypothetical protein